jgi:thiol:disulfide interchange protein DsbD
MEKGWHIYSQFMKGDGPIPTSIVYTFPKGVKAVGKTKEPTPVKHHDENFGMDVYYFNDHVEFVQPITGKYKKGDVVKGTVTYMTCNDEMCYPPVDVDFEVKL